jgi:hypothetical protein
MHAFGWDRLGYGTLKGDYFDRRQYTVSRLPDVAALKMASTALA